MRACPRGISWDLDHTLVGFLPTALDRFAALPQPDVAAEMGLRPGIGLRPGMAQTLARLSQRGYVHYVTTGATREYAERTLRSLDVRDFIAGIFAGDEIDVGLGKLYRPVAQALGLSDGEARRRLIAVGDVIYDQPADIDGLVFIHQPDGFRQDAATVADVILMLEDVGAGDMRAGFSALYSDARRVGRKVRRLGNGYLATMPSGASIYLEARRPLTQDAGAVDRTVPTVLLLTDAAIAYYTGEIG